MSLSKGSYAGQAEILRAAQKDESYISQMNEITCDLMLFGGRKFWLRYANYHFIFSSLLYYSSTTLSYLQTLGEEYTGIIPIDKASVKLLSLKKMFLYVVLLSGGHAILMNLVVYLENLTTKFAHKSINTTLLRSILMVFKNLIPYMERFNKTIFYFNGSYYSLVNRLLGVKHVLFQSWLKDEASLYGFKILAGVSLINLTASFLHSYSNWSATEIYVKVPEVKEDVQNLSTAEEERKAALEVKKFSGFYKFC